MIFFNEYICLSLVLYSVLFWTVIPDRLRTWSVILYSFIILIHLQPVFSALLLLVVGGTYGFARVISRLEDGSGRILSLAVSILVILLLGGKYLSKLFVIIFSDESSFAQQYIVPLGISYLCFKLIAFLIDVYRGIVEELSFAELLAFIVFIPMFPAGPIERYQNFAYSRIRSFDYSFYAEGLRRLAIGYAKKVILVNYLLNELFNKRLYPMVMSDGVNFSLPSWYILLFLFTALLYAYLDLSAYADIAIGYGRLFGYQIVENMNFPIFQSNISDYWARWHISLSSWCRNNVYFPVLGETRNMFLGLYASFAVMGLWHNLSLNWLIWGFWHATGVSVYSKWARIRRRYKRVNSLLASTPGFYFGVMLTVLYASIGYAFIMTDNSSGNFGSFVNGLKILANIFI